MRKKGRDRTLTAVEKKRKRGRLDLEEKTQTPVTLYITETKVIK